MPFKMVVRYLFPTIISFLFLVTSCKQKQQEVAEPDVNLSLEQETGTSMADFNTVLSDIEYLISTKISSIKDSAKGSYSKFLYISYDSLNLSGIKRGGSFKCFFSGERSLNNYSDSVVLDSTFINRRIFTGVAISKQIVSPKKVIYLSTVAQGKIQVPGGNLTSFSTELNRIYFGTGTKDIADDGWANEGQWTASESIGNSVQARIIVPLIVKQKCNYRFPVQGVVDFISTPGQEITRIKYGDGECDSNAYHVNSLGKRTYILQE